MMYRHSLKAKKKRLKKKTTVKTKKRTGKNYADYTGVIAYYSEGGKSVKITSGDQGKPLKLTHIYKSKKTANNAVKREAGKNRQSQEISKKNPYFGGIRIERAY